MSIATGLSVEQFLAGDWPAGAELIDGEVVVTDPTFEHQRLAGLLFAALHAWTLASPGRGLAGFGGNWTLAPGQSYKPDVWWVAEGRRDGLRGARSDVPPDLAVEVRSPGTWVFDLGPKRAVYEAAGVSELWLVDTPARAVLVHRRSTPSGAGFDVALEIGAGEQLTTPLLESFALDVDALFAEVAQS